MPARRRCAPTASAPQGPPASHSLQLPPPPHHSLLLTFYTSYSHWTWSDERTWAMPPYGAPIHPPPYPPFPHSGVGIGAALPWGYYAHHAPGQGIAPATPPPTPIPNTVAVQGGGPGPSDLDNYERTGVGQMDLERKVTAPVAQPLAPQPKRKSVHEEIREGDVVKGQPASRSPASTAVPPRVAEALAMSRALKLERTPTYCWVESATATSIGGHRQVTHSEMTLWAKNISLGTATKTLPPNILKNDHPPSKKTRALASAPEVHIAVNIAPMPGAGSSIMHESFVTTDSPVKQSTSAPGPAKVSDAAMHSLSCSAPPTTHLPVSHEPPNPLSRKSLLLLLLDCIESLRIPTTLELLSYMDTDEPTPDLKYVDIHSELYDHGVEDVVDVYSLPVELLSTLGSMGKVRAHRLHRYARDKFLIPLCLLENPELEIESSGDISVQEVEVITVEEDVTASLQVIAKSDDDCGKTIQPTDNTTQSRLGQGREDILQWLEGVTQVESDIEEVDGLASEADDFERGASPTSYEV
ncbi:hypothetical protein BJV77DRAFT_965207 [Russula vinacea]|nr:hypothetical protein BJV77DRAFT_965207 [Russula vinacea]